MEVPRKAGGGDDLPRVQLVFFIRHAESRWNRAQANSALISMMWENDHGLTELGLEQAEGLRKQIAAARGVQDGITEKTDWLEHFLSPDVVYTSPFTRAVETASIALNDLLPGGKLIVIREAREQKNFGGADSTGVAIGEAIARRVEEELQTAYETHFPERAAVAVKEFQAIELDVSGVHDEWWGPMTGDVDGNLAERLGAFVARLRSTRGQLEGGGGSTIVVGHSLFFRTLFTSYLTQFPILTEAGVAESLKDRVLPYCGVVGAKIEWDEEGRPVITEAVPMLSTQLACASRDQKGRGGSGGCVCGRGGELETCCAVA